MPTCSFFSPSSAIRPSPSPSPSLHRALWVIIAACKTTSSRPLFAGIGHSCRACTQILRSVRMYACTHVRMYASMYGGVAMKLCVYKGRLSWLRPAIQLHNGRKKNSRKRSPNDGYLDDLAVWAFRWEIVCVCARMYLIVYGYKWSNASVYPVATVVSSGSCNGCLSHCICSI
ncbi:hypothetical protein NTE_00265 [Candidatus Nitrososphaera evergladensis SR1]|uniref:Uncharacterized protein n=1 Tax=Candidatus Nitrososphaera evergladensis SR1 TaxID=1459636 RepID=A0A075MNG4_9ARCH|nr:hypothetical protein NTE_00265 [Candidatus Nitrososphaera evergladensis SR1]